MAPGIEGLNSPIVRKREGAWAGLPGKRRLTGRCRLLLPRFYVGFDAPGGVYNKMEVVCVTKGVSAGRGTGKKKKRGGGDRAGEGPKWGLERAPNGGRRDKN